MKLLCVITPCFNEEFAVDRCYQEVREVLEAIVPPIEYVHVFSDNASTDGTVQRLRDISAKDLRVKILVNGQNVGPFRNMASALQNIPAETDLVIPMIPADLQDPPSVIPEMLKKMTDGNSIIYGIRKNRQESRRLKIARGAYYRLLRRLGATAPPAHAGEFMLITKEVAEFVNSNNEDHPYIRGLVAKSGYPFNTVAYDWEERKVGKSRNSWMDLLDQGLNGLIKTTRAPARLAIFFGILIAIAGFSLALLTLILQISGIGNSTRGIPTVLIAMSVLGGTQLVFLGVIGEYILDIHTKLHSSHPVRIVERVNF
jgi:glycosyltransferase involved in cell wall biosynthesis